LKERKRRLNGKRKAAEQAGTPLNVHLEGEKREKKLLASRFERKEKKRRERRQKKNGGEAHRTKFST